MKLESAAIASICLIILVFGCQRKSVVKKDDIVDPGITIGDTLTAGKIEYAGVRSSSYGINPFPDPAGWKIAMESMSSYFEGSTPCAIWILGVMGDSKTCHIEMPSNGKTYKNIHFSETEFHTNYLRYFDNAGIKVFLQIEPASANMNELIDLVLGKYQQHPCVIGFGIDVEWYRVSENPGWGVKVEDDSAKAWEAKVKSYNNDYRLFLKHWDRNWMPPEYRGDIIFVDDSQGFENFASMEDEFVNYWAKHFHPNTVYFQFGYSSDKSWWQYLTTPPQYIGAMLEKNIEQNFGLFWIDFTLRDIFPIPEK